MAHAHSIYDTDPHFAINARTRAIVNKSETKTVLIQHDHNSERFTFELPRYIDGHDMTLCNTVRVHYCNVNSATKEVSKGPYEVQDMQLSPEDDTVAICSWLVSRNATMHVGSLSFLLEFSCIVDGVTEYSWHTAVHSGVSVSVGMSNEEEVVEDYVDILQQWRDELFQAKPSTDRTLTEAGVAADAAAVGAELRLRAPAITQEASGETVTITDAAAWPALSVVSTITSTQTGTPSSDNVCPISRQDVTLYHAAAYDAAAEPVLTAALPDSVYGGTLDWATGEISMTQMQYVPKGADITNYGVASTGVPYVQLVLPAQYTGSGAQCSHYPVVTGASTKAAVRLVAPRGCYIYDPRFTDLETAAALIDAEQPQVVYTLVDPQTVQIEPVTLTLLEGSNALWSGYGETSVRYVVDMPRYFDRRVAELQG